MCVCVCVCVCVRARVCVCVLWLFLPCIRSLDFYKKGNGKWTPKSCCHSVDYYICTYVEYCLYYLFQHMYICRYILHTSIIMVNLWSAPYSSVVWLITISFIFFGKSWPGWYCNILSALVLCPNDSCVVCLVTPHTRCRLKVLKLERILDFLKMEEELIQNMERLRPQSRRRRLVSFSVCNCYL